MHSHQFYVYILASKTKHLYTGVTGDLVHRLAEHKAGTIPGFTRRYGITRLVYFEVAAEAEAAIVREKQIKGWVRRKKIALIETQNSAWEDLSETW